MITTDTPLTISGLFSWYKADAIAQSNGSAVATWPDSSGNGRNATQATGTNQPILRIPYKNGLPAVDFDGTNDFMMATGSTTDTFSVFVVFSLRTSATDRTLFQDGNANGFVLQVHTPAATPLRELGYRAVIDNTGGTYTNNTQEIWCGTRATGASGQGVLYNRGTSDLTTTSSLSTPSATVSLGALDGGTANFADGYISEVIFYNTLISASDRARVHTYLAVKYGITTSDQINYRTIGSVTRPAPFKPGFGR